MSDAAALSIPTRRIHEAAEILMSRTTPVASLHLRSKDGDTMPPGLATALANAPCLRGIRSLHVEELDLGAGALAVIVDSRNFAELEELNLEDCDWSSKLGPALATALAGASLPRLERLALSSIRIGAAGSKRLGHTRRLPRLRRLVLGACAVGDDGLRALVGSPLFTQLHQLVLLENDITDAGIDVLRGATRPPSLGSLTVLELGALSPASEQVLAAWGA